MKAPKLKGWRELVDILQCTPKNTLYYSRWFFNLIVANAGVLIDNYQLLFVTK